MQKNLPVMMEASTCNLESLGLKNNVLLPESKDLHSKTI